MTYDDLFEYDNDEIFYYDLRERERERERDGVLINEDCMNVLKHLDDNAVSFTITDIPYDSVNRKDNGLRKLDKGKADILTFDLQSFLEQVYRVTSGSIVIFCGMNQVSSIFNFFDTIAKNGNGTVRQLVWKKTNPSPMNGDYIYLSGIENAVWFKNRGATFNAHCKSNVFEFPCGRSKLHPTEKNHLLLADLIKDNTNENDIILDTCCGSGSHCYVAKDLKRRYIGIELNKEYFDIAKNRLNDK